MGLVYERLQHQRKSVHVEVPPYGIFDASLQMGRPVTFTIYTKITVFSVTTKGKNVKKAPGKHNRPMNNL